MAWEDIGKILILLCNFTQNTSQYESQGTLRILATLSDVSRQKITQMVNDYHAPIMGNNQDQRLIK